MVSSYSALTTMFSATAQILRHDATHGVDGDPPSASCRMLKLRLPSQQIGLQRANGDRQQDSNEHHDEDGDHHLAGVGARLRFDDELAEPAFGADELADDD